MRLELEHRSNSPAATLDEPRDFDPQISDDPAILVTKGIAAAQKGDREHARELLTQATNLDPASENAWMWLASISDYPEELLAFLNKVLNINPQNLRALEWHAATRSLLSKTFVQRGIAAYNKNSVELADSCFDEALSHDDSSALAWFWKARVSSSDDKKIGYLERALEIDPGNEVARQSLDLLKPPTPEATLEEAKWAAVAGKRKQALEILDKVLTNGHASAEAWVLRSHLTLRLAEKVEALEMALELEPDNPTARASYDFLTATVRDAHMANDQDVQEDEVDETVQTISVEPATQVADEGRSIEEILNPAPEYIDPDHQTVENISVSPFLERVDDLASTQQPSESFEPAVAATEPVAEVAAVDPPLQAYELPVEEAPQDEMEPFEVVDVKEIFVEGEAIPAPSTGAVCAFCDGPVEPQAFECTHCHAVLTLSDIESLLANQSADHNTIQQAITIMEAEWTERDSDVQQLTILGIGHFNLRSFEKGFKYLQEASRLEPNNVILGGQVNALAIRLDEMQRQQEIDESKPKGRTILVVDDSATVRKLISAKLEKSGHHVTCAADGVEGLEKLEGGMPDLVLLDITMPRMDGYEVCKQIRSNPAAAGLPVVMISGKDGFFDKVRGKMAGCTGYVTKPFGPETLMKALETYLLPDSDRRPVSDPLPENDHAE